MQSSRANRTGTFRLHRISKANSVKKHSQTFYLPDESFKLASINSVNQGVKHNDLTFLTGHDLNKLRKEPVEGQDHFYESAHSNLTEVRKKYDDMRKQRVQKDENITRLKEQINKYNIFEGEYKGKIQNAKDELSFLESELNRKKNELEETMMEIKVLRNVEKRLKNDKVVYDQRKFNLEKEYQFQKKQKIALKKDGHSIEESSERTSKIHKQLVSKLRDEKQQRLEHLNNLENMIQIKQNCIQTNVRRENQINEIAERALQDKNFDEKQWQNIYLTHTFVNKMLRNKIDREMQKFQVVEFAFKQIKTATGVNDAKSLVYKYLNKEAVYGDLLGRITANEQRIDELKDQTERLHEEAKELEGQRENIQNIKIKSIDLSSDIKNMNIIEEKKKGVQTHKNKIGQWLCRQFKKFNNIEKGEEGISLPKNNAEIEVAFNKYLQVLLKCLNKCDVEEPKDETTEAGDLSAKDSARVTRILPKRPRKNSAGEQIFDVDEEQTNQHAQGEQFDLINAQREELLKNNEKFMREAKRRQEEKRKLLIEKTVEKKEKKVEVKKEEEDD